MQGVNKRVDRDEDFARDEVGGAAIETALLLSLVATFVFVLRSTNAGPLMQRFVDAANTLSKAFG